MRVELLNRILIVIGAVAQEYSSPKWLVLSHNCSEQYTVNNSTQTPKLGIGYFILIGFLTLMTSDSDDEQL